jgi:hypothetical protein
MPPGAGREIVGQPQHPHRRAPVDRRSWADRCRLVLLELAPGRQLDPPVCAQRPRTGSAARRSGACRSSRAAAGGSGAERSRTVKVRVVRSSGSGSSVSSSARASAASSTRRETRFADRGDPTSSNTATAASDDRGRAGDRSGRGFQSPADARRAEEPPEEQQREQQAGGAEQHAPDEVGVLAVGELVGDDRGDLLGRELEEGVVDHDAFGRADPHDRGVDAGRAQAGLADEQRHVRVPGGSTSSCSIASRACRPAGARSAAAGAGGRGDAATRTTAASAVPSSERR